MAGYRDELERLNFSAEEKEALTCRLLRRLCMTMPEE